MWSFAELNRQANRLANLFLGLGVAPGEKVVWCGQNSLDALRAIHALPKVGAVAVPLNYRLTAEETAYVVDTPTRWRCTWTRSRRASSRASPTPSRASAT